jgi:hypothetical protein
MFKGFLVGFLIAVALLALILYVYGRKTMTDMSAPNTNTIVAQAIPQINWVPFTSPTKKFEAKFPSIPQHAIDRLIDPKTNESKEYEMYISETGGKVFMISIISYPKLDKIKDEEATLRKIIDDMVSSSKNNKLQNIQFGTYEGHKKADFLITDTAYALQGLAFVSGNQLYVISNISKSPTESKNEFDYFVKSFNLKSDQSVNKAQVPAAK